MTELNIKQKAQLLQLMRTFDPRDDTGVRERLTGELERELAAREAASLPMRLERIEQLLAKQAEQAEQAEQDKTKIVRSAMSAAAKSKFIREHGLDRYNEIPWK
jgi:Trp operon repressor